MTKDKSIYIRNIYYMLAYAFQSLREKKYEKVILEAFDTEQDLFAYLLVKSAASQLKHGLYREYTVKRENLTVMRGKLDVTGTIQNRMQKRYQLACEYDELSENNLFNQILKTALYYMAHGREVRDKKRKNELKGLLLFFDGIDLLQPKSIPWNKLYYRKENRQYEMLMNLCYLILEHMIQTTQKGDYRVLSLADDQMEKLYEVFILEYYRRHHSYLHPVSAPLEWDIQKENEDASMIRLLPKMKTDTMLTYKGRTLIIDAKYYTEALVQHFGKETLRSAHLYQLFAYVKNHDTENTGNTGGLLLYARTDEEIPPELECQIGKNMIAAKALDLNMDFKGISEQLDQIVLDFFPACTENKS